MTIPMLTLFWQLCPRQAMQTGHFMTCNMTQWPSFSPFLAQQQYLSLTNHTYVHAKILFSLSKGCNLGKVVQCPQNRQLQSTFGHDLLRMLSMTGEPLKSKYLSKILVLELTLYVKQFIINISRYSVTKLLENDTLIILILLSEIIISKMAAPWTHVV